MSKSILLLILLIPAIIHCQVQNESNSPKEETAPSVVQIDSSQSAEATPPQEKDSPESSNTDIKSSEGQSEEEYALSPYNFNIGSNFDFLDGVNLKDVYFNLSTFSPNLLGKKDSPKKWGLIAGARKSFSGNYDQFIKEVKVKDKYINDQLSYIEKDFLLEETTLLELTNTNFSFTPIYELYNTESGINNPIKRKLRKTDEVSFKAYLGLDIDVMKQDLVYNLTYDTLQLTENIITETKYDSIQYPFLDNRSAQDQYIYSLGLLAPFLIQSEKALLYGSVGGGFSQIRGQYRDEEIEELKTYRFDRIYLKMSIEVVDLVHGFNLRAEYRFFETDRAPYINFSISKYFDLQKVFELIL